MPYFKYNNHKCYYETRGDGAPLLFLHGNTASSKMFDSVVDCYADYYKVFLIDFLGHGKSDMVDEFSPDLWFDEAMQVIAFLEQVDMGIEHHMQVNIVGCSGGALVAINVALEKPERVGKVIADSFEGKTPLDTFVCNVIEEREASKRDESARAFYQLNHGENWQQVVDNDTFAIYTHSKTIGRFFHKPLESLQASVLLTGSRSDEYVTAEFYEQTYSQLLSEIPNGRMFLFEQGGHPAMLSNPVEFMKIAREFIG